MTVMTRRRARAARDAAMRRLADLIDELEPGVGVHPAVVDQHRVVIALDAALAAAPWWARTVRVALAEQWLTSSAHKQPVTC